MNLLSMIFGNTGKKPQTKKQAWEKFKIMFEDQLLWYEPSVSLLPENLKTIDIGTITLIGKTSIKEINGIVENNLRISGFASPTDFISWKVMLSDRDEFYVAITHQGMNMLSRLGLKPKARGQSTTQH